MTSNEIQRLCIAPEIVVVDLVDAALDALHRALLAQHPMIVGEASADQPLIRRRATRILRRAERLQRALDAYRAAAAAILDDLPDRHAFDGDDAF
jgi:hypothetical protein